MYDDRMNLTRDVEAENRAHFPETAFRTVVPRNVRLAEAPSYGLPGVVFDAQSKGAQAFVQFAHEMVARICSPR